MRTIRDHYLWWTRWRKAFTAPTFTSPNPTNPNPNPNPNTHTQENTQ